MPPSPLSRVRKLCLSLPQAHEVEAWGEPTFRVKNKLFAMHASSDTHHGSGREGVWIMGRPHLAAWLRHRRGRAVDLQHIRRMLAG